MPSACLLKRVKYLEFNLCARIVDDSVEKRGQVPLAPSVLPRRHVTTSVVPAKLLYGKKRIERKRN